MFHVWLCWCWNVILVCPILMLFPGWGISCLPAPLGVLCWTGCIALYGCDMDPCDGSWYRQLQSCIEISVSVSVGPWFTAMELNPLVHRGSSLPVIQAVILYSDWTFSCCYAWNSYVWISPRTRIGVCAKEEVLEQNQVHRNLRCSHLPKNNRAIIFLGPPIWHNNRAPVGPGLKEALGGAGCPKALVH